MRGSPSQTQRPVALMQLEEIRALVSDDLKRVDETIVDRLASDVVLVNQISQYIVGGGGKRLRPLSVVLAARACGHQGSGHVAAAAIVFVASAITAWMRMSSSSTIIWNERE